MNAASDSSSVYFTLTAIAALILFLGGVVLMLIKLKNSTSTEWNLWQALSEEVTVKDSSGHETTIWVASSSRLIAFVGSLVMIAAFFGVASYILWALFHNPDGLKGTLSGLAPFFLSGSALFAPYAFNKMADAFKPA